MRLALDAMGGDHAPQAMVDGAFDYATQHTDQEIILVGDSNAIKKSFGNRQQPKNISIEHASEIIGMGDKMSAVREKKDDSINVSSKLVKEGKADAMVLCGNTACSVSAAQMHLRRIKGIKRAGILTPLPTKDNITWVIDCGANATGKPEHLVQFGEMASHFLRFYDNDGKNPSIGVLSIGSEIGKGDELTKETLELLEAKKGLNVIGNVEGNDIFKGTSDIVVCDGFTGNVVLKAAEGVATLMSTMIRERITAGFLRKIAAFILKPAFSEVRQRTHWTLVGGCVLLGVDGVCIIGHGRSDRVAVYHALGQAARCVKHDVMAQLRDSLSQSQTNNSQITSTQADKANV